MATILKYKIKVLGFIHTTFIYLLGQFGGFEGWCVPKKPKKTQRDHHVNLLRLGHKAIAYCVTNRLNKYNQLAFLIRNGHLCVIPQRLI